MQQEATVMDQEERSIFAPRLYGIALMVAVVVLFGLWLVTRYIALDVARDMRIWEEKLNLIAESRAADLNKYVNAHFAELQSLSTNPSLQLYLTELQAMQDAPAGKSERSPAQLDYLRNLLVFTAQRGGYMAQAADNMIPANVEDRYAGGLAVMNSRNEMVVSTVTSPAMKEVMLAQAELLGDEEQKLIDLKKYEDGHIYMGYIVPVFSIQGDHNAKSRVGSIIALRMVDDEFFSLLKHPGVTEKTLETLLVRSAGGSLEFLSPLLDKSQALAKQLDANERRFVEARLSRMVGNFVSDMKDYAQKRVLATSRAIAGTPWVMVVKLERDEALNGSSKNRNNMIAFFFLMIAIIALLLVAIWWHASSKRSLMLSTHYRSLAAQAQAQEQLLRLVSDHQPEPIFILDDQHCYQFANRKAAENVGMSPESLLGKHVQDVRGSACARHISDQCEAVRHNGQIGYRSYTHEEHGKTHSYRAVYVPVAHIPVLHLPAQSPGVLIIEQDITEVVGEREKRLQINQDLIDTLVTLVDRRDPFAANHSLLVSSLAQHIAIEMEQDLLVVETTRIAASLMNIGKIVVSKSLLTKTDPLTEEERFIIRNSMLDAAELVRGIHFDGPVYETLRQWQERWDGAGLLALKGEEILISARILSVANTLVGMISPRSWRTAMTLDAAVQFLLNNCGSLFDRRVVVALVHFLEHQRGKSWLSGLVIDKEAA